MPAWGHHIQRRGAIYHLRVRIPEGLRARFGMREVRRSLETRCPLEAKHRAGLLYPVVSRVVAEAEKGDVRDAIIETLERALEEAWETIENQQRSADLRVRNVELRAVTSERQAVEHQHPLIGRLQVLVDRLDEPIAALGQAENIARRSEAIREVRDTLREFGLPAANLPTPTVTQYLNQTYLKEKRLKDDGRRHIVNYITWFARITGDKPIGSYTRSDIVNYVRTLERMKNTLGKSDKDVTLTIDQQLEQTKRRALRTMSEVTVQKHLTHVKAMMLVATGDYNFATSDRINTIYRTVELSEHVPKSERRKRWSIDQLNALFASPIWTGTAAGPRDLTRRHEPGAHIYKDAYWWLPVVALWTGARLEEIAQLEHEDLLRDMGGIQCIKVHDEGDRRVKNRNSVRFIPVHAFLVEIGFLNLFKPGKKGQIWPELRRRGRMNKLSDLYSAHFTDYRRACGLYERLRDFHSLRVSAISTLWELRVPPLSIARLVGHDSAFPELEKLAQTKDYIHFEMGPLAEDMAKLEYRGLDLLPLRAAGGPKG